jgi:hypothetical protein
LTTSCSRIFSRGAVAAVLACLAGPVASAAAQVTITAGPTGLSNSRTAAFEFTGPDGVNLECQLRDLQPVFDPCAGLATFNSLPDGDYVFEVRTIDPNPVSDLRAFTVDAAPETTITEGPAVLSNNTTPVFSFTGSEAGTFECRHYRQGEDAPAFSPGCSSPRMLGPLGDGVWVFEVAAIDAAGNTDPTPAPATFVIDATAPDTAIVGGPTGPTNDPTPELSFTSTEAAAFECRHFRAGSAAPAFAPCASSQALGQLADGAYEFEVRAVDGLGNADLSPASRAFHVDTVPPQTEITGGPGDTTAATAVFLFSAPGAAGVSCRLDGGAWQPCESPQAYSGLSLGGHSFEVTAVDAAGNADPTPAHHAWQVLKPGLVIPAAVKQATALARELVQIRRALARLRLRALARRRAVLFRSFDALTAGTVDISARARVRQGARRRWIAILQGRREVAGAGRHRVRATITNKGRRLAGRRARLPLELRLSFTDLAGRSLWATSELTLKR